MLNDDVVASDAPLEVRRARITAIANSHAKAHHGRIGFIYETAIKGYSIELPNEAAAIALSQDPQVKFIEEEGLLQVMDDKVLRASRRWQQRESEPLRRCVVDSCAPPRRR